MFSNAFLQDIFLTAVVVVSLGAGVASILLAYNLNNKYRFNYLISYEYFQILTIIFGVFGLLGTMIVRQVLRDFIIEVTLVETIVQLLPFLSVPFLVAAWYMFIRLSAEMVNVSLSRIFTISYFLFQSIFFISYGFVILRFADLKDESIENATSVIKLTMIAMHAITLLISYYFLYFRGAGLKDKVHRGMVLYFGHINLFVQVLGIILFYFTDRYVSISLVYLVIYFGGGILPLLFLGSRLKKDFNIRSGQEEDQLELSDLLFRHEISRREQEIIDKICEGLTNQQISDVLFISLQTVKDHSHNIYRKLGVKNRVQMVNMIRNHPDK